jgi:hypothetical protein
VRGLLGEPGAPDDPANGHVWSAIVRQTDLVNSNSDFISTEDTKREVLARHPWNMGGGNAAEVQAIIEEGCLLLVDFSDEIGITAVTGADDGFTFGSESIAKRFDVGPIVPFVVGEAIRDFRITFLNWAIWPHDNQCGVVPLAIIPAIARHLWPLRAAISSRRRFGTPMLARGLSWYEFQELYPSKLQNPYSLVFATVATHNHIVFDRGGKIFNSKSPVIKLKPHTKESEYLGFLGLLSSSTACFWLKQVCHNKGSTVDDRGARQRTAPFEDFYEFMSTRIEYFPVATTPPIDLGSRLDALSQRLAMNLPSRLCTNNVITRSMLDDAKVSFYLARHELISLQEELDWHCYRLYGLHEAPPEHPAPPVLRLGERAFEIVMARQMEAGVLRTTWFDRHGSTPITDLPSHWPDDYRHVVEQRIALIETDANIGMIERPEFKRRWSTESWEDMEQAALRTWLLDRMESPSIWTEGDCRLLSTNQLADRMRRDADFLSVAALYAGWSEANLEALVAELIAKESVPFLAAVRYAETGLRKRAQWGATWDKQRREDAIDAEVAARRDTFRAQAERRAQEQWRTANPRRPGEEPEPYAIRMQAGAGESVERQIDKLVAEEQRRRKREEVGDIPVPPKYVTKDFQSTDFWRLRGGLDVPKERFVSFPHCQWDADGSLVVTWAGHNQLKRALATAAYYQERKDNDGWPAERLVPLLAGVIELVPWLLQWHNEYDPDLGARMGDYFVDFVQMEARALGMTEAAVAAWAPPAASRRGRSRRATQ